MIDRTDRTLPLSAQAELLNLSRASLYYTRRGPSAKEVRLKHRIDELYTQYPFYGARRRIHRQLCQQRVYKGSYANFVLRWLCSNQSDFEQVKVGTTIHLSLQHFQPINLPFNRSIRPFQPECSPYRR